MFKLLIHHHAIAHITSDGTICLPSFIARWVDALADHFDEIGLLLHQSAARSPQQDECIHKANVKLYSLSTPGHRWDHFERVERIRKVCMKISRPEDILLVRGITPRQEVVWNAVHAVRKAFLLVGMPEPAPVSSIRSFLSLWPFFASRYRIIQFKRMINKGQLLVNAPSLVSRIQQNFGIPAIFIPTNTIRNNEFSEETFIRQKVLNHHLNLLFCGRVTRSKGMYETLETVCALAQNGIDSHLHVVGTAGEGESLYSFKSFAASLKITDRITWHGHVPFGVGLFTFYRQADMLLLPSYSEGVPHVLWEAAAHGCLIITTKVGGIQALFKHNKHALLVPPRDFAPLQKAILRLLASQELQETLRSNAYDLAKAYAVETCARSLADQLLGSSWH